MGVVLYPGYRPDKSNVRIYGESLTAGVACLVWCDLIGCWGFVCVAVLPVSQFAHSFIALRVRLLFACGCQAVCRIDWFAYGLFLYFFFLVITNCQWPC